MSDPSNKCKKNARNMYAYSPVDSERNKVDTLPLHWTWIAVYIAAMNTNRHYLISIPSSSFLIKILATLLEVQPSLVALFQHSWNISYYNINV